MFIDSNDFDVIGLEELGPVNLFRFYISRDTMFIHDTYDISYAHSHCKVFHPNINHVSRRVYALMDAR